MQGKVSRIKSIFIKKMFYSLLTQILVLGVLIILARNYINDSQLNVISNELLIKDQFTIDQITGYRILGENYALDLELHNIGDMRKLDTVEFLPQAPQDKSYKGSSILLNDRRKKIYKLSNNKYYGVTTIVSDGKVLGYVVTKKKYDSIFIVPVSYDLFLILVTAIGAFIFNFVFLFLSLKNRLESNTKLLLEFASAHENTSNALSEINITEYKILAEKIIAEKDEIEKLQKEKALAETAAHVAHDIRSPLAVMDINLQMLEKDIPNEQMTMLKSAIQSIRDIANNLLERYRKQNGESVEEKTNFMQDNGNIPRPLLLQNLLEQVVSQKRHEWMSMPLQLILSIDRSAISSWVNISPNALKRVLSNLLNNAHEAIFTKGIIEVKLCLFNEILQIKIIDNGSGIPSDKIFSVLNGESLKHVGKGLGLSTAAELMSTLHGNIALISAEGTGTEVILSLPPDNPPMWLPQEISLISNGTVIVLDDDASMQAFWQHRLHGYNVNLKIFSRYDDAVKWYQNLLTNEPVTFLVDYDLAENDKNGLSFLKLTGNKAYAYLITSHAEEVIIQNNIQELGTWLIPKILVSEIPIVEK